MLRKKKRGISIIEVIISLAIIAIIIIPMSNLIIHAVKINKGGEDKQQAAYIGQQIVEGLNVNDIEDKNGNYLPQNISVNGGLKEFNLSQTGNSSADVGDYNVTLDVVRDNSISLSNTTATYDSTVVVDWESSKKTFKVILGASNALEFSTSVANLYVTINNNSLEFKVKNEDGSFTTKYNPTITSTFNSLGARFENYDSATPYNIYLTNNTSNQVNIYLEKTQDKLNWVQINPNGGVMGAYDVITNNKDIKNYNVAVKVYKSGQQLYELRSNIRK